jgi:hypothetical protein
MFDARYSRLKFWIWSLILLIINIPFAIISKVESNYSQNTDDLIVSIIILSLPSIIWINTLANRIRDYGSNPWIALFALLPIVNIFLALYYGIKQYKTVNNTENNDISLTKAVYNHAKDLSNEIKPAINEYKEKHTTSNFTPPPTTSNNISDNSNISENNPILNEDEIYEKIMLEIEENKKVKSTWAKALAQSDGDDKKADSLYINLRVTQIKEEQQLEFVRIKEEEQKELEYRLTDEGKQKSIIDNHKKQILNNDFNELKLYIINFYSTLEYFTKINNNNSLMLKHNDFKDSYIYLKLEQNSKTLEIYNVIHFETLEPLNIKLTN